MTWGEFKQLMTERGVRDDEEICYIDISYPDHDEINIDHVERPEGMPTGVAIWS